MKTTIKDFTVKNEDGYSFGFDKVQKIDWKPISLLITFDDIIFIGNKSIKCYTQENIFLKEKEEIEKHLSFYKNYPCIGFMYNDTATRLIVGNFINFKDLNFKMKIKVLKDIIERKVEMIKWYSSFYFNRYYNRLKSKF